VERLALTSTTVIVALTVIAASRQPMTVRVNLDVTVRQVRFNRLSGESFRQSTPMQSFVEIVARSVAGPGRRPMLLAPWVPLLPTDAVTGELKPD